MNLFREWPGLEDFLGAERFCGLPGNTMVQVRRFFLAGSGHGDSPASNTSRNAYTRREWLLLRSFVVVSGIRQFFFQTGRLEILTEWLDLV